MRERRPSRILGLSLLAMGAVLSACGDGGGEPPSVPTTDSALTGAGRQAALAFLRQHIGAVASRWVESPIPIGTETPLVPVSDLAEAASFWTASVGIRFVAVPSGGTIVARADPAVPGCALTAGGTISANVISFAPVRIRPGCWAGLSPSQRVDVLAHELGHALGISGHPAGNPS